MSHTHAQSVLITGALSGIGEATAIAFAKKGAKIVVSGRKEEVGKALAAKLKTLGAAQAEFIKADVSKEADVKHLVSEAVKHLGHLDVAVNNAGVEGTLGALTDFTAENFHHVFDTNVLGVLLCLKYQLPVMAAQKSGSIINLSSVAGHIGFMGAAVYVASKHAVEGLTKTAALEVAALGVRVNAVAPGPIETAMINRFTGHNADAKAGMAGMIPAKRLGEPSEIAETIVFLASDGARYLTGQSIAVDGGFLAQ